MVNIGCFIFVGCIGGAYVLDFAEGYDVAFAACSVAITLVRQFLQHFSTSPTQLPTRLPTKNEVLEAFRISGVRVAMAGEANYPEGGLAKVATFLGSWQGMRLVSLVNMISNLLVFSASKSHYSKGDLAGITKAVTSLSEPKYLWFAAVLLSILGVIVDALALWTDMKSKTDATLPEGRLGNFLRDHHYHRSSLLRACLLFVKLQLVTTGIRCSCVPYKAGMKSFVLEDYRSYCSHGSTSEDIVFRTLLSIQIIFTCGALALMESFYVKPLLELRMIPGVRRPRLLVWSYVVHSGLLQLATLFLSAESVFLPEIVHGASCQRGGGTINDSAFSLAQSNMNSGLSLAVVVLIVANNMWRDALDPFVQAMEGQRKQREESSSSDRTWTVDVSEIYDWENVRGAGTLIFVYTVATTMTSCALTRSSQEWTQVWVLLSLGIFAAFALVVDTPFNLGAIFTLILLPPSLTFAVELAKRAPKLNMGHDEFAVDSVAWLLLVAAVGIVAFMDPRLCLKDRNYRSNAFSTTERLSGVLPSRLSIQAHGRPFYSHGESNSEDPVVKQSTILEEKERTRESVFSRLGLWNIAVGLSILAMVIASIVVAAQDNDRRIRNEDLGQLQLLYHSTSSWARHGGWDMRSEFIACVWGGVACKRRNSDLIEIVTGLSLPFSTFKGLPPVDFFQKLPYLELIDLSGNFAGPPSRLQPSIFNQSTALNHLNLSFTPLAGELPPSLCSLPLKTLSYACFQTLPACLQRQCTNGQVACAGGGSPVSLEALLLLPTYTEQQSCLAATPWSLTKNTYFAGISIEIGPYVNAIIDGRGFLLSGMRNSTSTKKAFVIVERRASLELKSITLKSSFDYTVLLGGNLITRYGCFFIDSPSAVYIGKYGTCSLDNSTFRGHQNGTIINKADSKTVISARYATFEGNRGLIGACVLNYGTFVADYAIMLNNSAYLRGGVAYNLGKFTADHAEFSHNTAQVKGGAVFNRAKFHANYAKFIGNFADVGGGAIYSTQSVKKACSGKGACCKNNMPDDEEGCNNLKCSAI